ncbi:MAG TPA: alkaline shock response membrane anchor protein AmaP [Dehalococcoidia bacterium]|nr:alkaline shock response membrane anchor protein AmaP [Dehalococcoidia bacterium]
MVEKSLAILDRWIVALIAIAALVVGAVILVVAMDWRSPVDMAPSGWLRDQLVTIDSFTGRDQKITVICTLIGGGIALALLLAQFTPLFTRRREPMTYNAHGSRVNLDKRSLSRLVEDAVRSAPNVQDVDAHVKQTPRGIMVRTRAKVDPGSNIQQVSNDISDNIRQVLSNQAGVAVAGVDLNLAIGKEKQTGRWHLPGMARRH